MNLLNKVRCVHMIGIKGTGMSALAVNLKSMGIAVSGSDFAESFFTDVLLAKNKINVSTPFAPTNIPADTDLVITSTAYDNKNLELQEAERRGLRIMTYPQVLGLITKRLKSIAICGSHGKTTTSGILSYILSKTSYRPIVNVGSIVPQLVNYKARDPKFFIFEADEYQNKFQYFYPKIVILTNIDYDHPDYFKDERHYKSVFSEFVKKIPANGLLIYCADDASACDIADSAKCKTIGYGLSKIANYPIEVIEISPLGMSFNLTTKTSTKSRTLTHNIHTKLMGNHNALNLTAAIICARYLGVDDKLIKKASAEFTGTKRRLEIIKKCRINSHNCIMIDDYGHHPTEIMNTIATIKMAYPDKTLWTVFQPHTFSRTEALFNDFAKSFDLSDKTIVLDIYASKRETGSKIHSRDLVKAMAPKKVFYKPNITQAADFLKKKINTDSIILTIGASNVWELSRLI